MLRIESKQTETPRDTTSREVAEGEGFLFLGVLVASWVVAIAVGWVIWRMAPL